MALMTVADRSHGLVRLQADRGLLHRMTKTEAVGAPAVWPDLVLTRITHVHDLVPTPDHPAVVGLIPVLLAVIGHGHDLTHDRGPTHDLLAVTGLVRGLDLSRAHTLDLDRARTLDHGRARTHAAAVTRRTPAHRHHGVAALVDPRASVGAQTLLAVAAALVPNLVKSSLTILAVL